MPARVGDLAVAACPLYPSGRVLIGNVPYPARTSGKSIEAGGDVVVVGGDKFCLLVRAIESVQPVESLPNFGEVILLGKELADAASAEAHEAARQRAEEYRRDLRRLTIIGLATGLVLGLILVAVQIYRVGFTPDLWLVPPVASIGFACLAAWFLWFGSETNETLLLIAAVTATVGLFAGTYFFGPLAGVAISLCSGFAVSLLAVLVVAMKGPET